jgi:murein DD-endopeptidase MepM/ murein hydrolase activator NlpD
VALAAAPVLATGGCLGAVLLTPTPPPPAVTCGPVGATTAIDPAGLSAGSVAGYSGQQLVNAAHVINAAVALGLGARAQTIGVMTAMGESSLRVLDRGDAVGPDSRGLFQQRGNGAWGSYAQRMDPTASATSFYRALVQVEAWDTLAPTIAAHRTQRNADPFHYERFWAPAVDVVEALTRSGGAPDAPTAAPAAAPAGSLTCLEVVPEGVPVEGWTRPAVGPVTSQFGTRRHPVTGKTRLHAGTDIGAPCGAPVFAAAAGRVVTAGPASGYGNLITVDHGGGTTTRYAHMYNDAVLTRVGATVAAGQQIAEVGSSGTSTGCHLHFEVRRGDGPFDPVAFMAEQGAALT